MKIDPQRLYVSVFRGNKDIGVNRDLESAVIWKDIFKKNNLSFKDVDFAEEKGMQDGRLFFLRCV